MSLFGVRRNLSARAFQPPSHVMARKSMSSVAAGSSSPFLTRQPPASVFVFRWMGLRLPQLTDPSWRSWLTSLSMLRPRLAAADSANLNDKASSTYSLAAMVTYAGAIFTDLLADLLQQAVYHIKRTYQPSVVRRKRKGGFLVRNRSKKGRKILHRRRLKGRKRLDIGICK